MALPDRHERDKVLWTQQPTCETRIDGTGYLRPSPEGVRRLSVEVKLAPVLVASISCNKRCASWFNQIALTTTVFRFAHLSFILSDLAPIREG